MRSLILAVSLFLVQTSFGQFSITEGASTEKPVFPVLEAYSTGHTTILPTWTPGKKFLQENPNFLRGSGEHFPQREPRPLSAFITHPLRDAASLTKAEVVGLR